MHPEKMKRKVAKVGRLRLSPNEEDLLLKEELNRRRKLRLQQVREQERFIALQIRQDVKQRRDEQLQQLAEDLKAEWQKAQAEKLGALERLYQTALNAVGEGHQQAKENEPDLKATANQVAMRKQKAEKRHRIALKELKQQKERELREQSRHIKARQQALQAEKERAAKIASLPPPLDPFLMVEEIKRIPTVKVCDVDNFSVTHYHLLEPYVEREMDTEQPDARLAAKEEAKRMDDLQKDDAIERQEQLEKARLRGNHALKRVHLAQDREKLLKELEQMQSVDLARRRQIVAQMPQQLFEPGYRRTEIKEEWQRELEFAFEDLYTENRKVKGDMVLRLEPEPLPAPSVQTQDEDLDLSVEPDHVYGKQHESADGKSGAVTSDSVPTTKGPVQPPSNLVLKKLLSKIRTQKNHWMSKTEVETFNDTIESGSLPVRETQLDGNSAEQNGEKELHADVPPIDPPQLDDSVIVSGKSVLLHPQEQATKIRMTADKQKQLEAIEQQKQQQLVLLQQLEFEKLRLESDYLELHLQMQKNKERETDDQVQMNMELPLHQNEKMEEKNETPTVSKNILKEEDHLQMIRNYQQHLLQQNKEHHQSIQEARKHLQEYQAFLKKRYPSVSTTSLDSAAVPASEYENVKSTAGTTLEKEAPEMFHSRVHSVTHEPSKLIEDQHKKAVDEARKQLLDYQAMLRRKYPSSSRTALDSVITKEKAQRNQESKMEVSLQGDAVEMLQSRTQSLNHKLSQHLEPVSSYSEKPTFLEEESKKVDQPMAGISRELLAMFRSRPECFQKALKSQLMPVGVSDVLSDTEVKQLSKSSEQTESVCTLVTLEVDNGLHSLSKNHDESTAQKSLNSPKEHKLKWVPEIPESQEFQAKSSTEQVLLQDSRDASLELSNSQPFLPSAGEQQLSLLSYDHPTGPGDVQEQWTQKNFSSVLEFRERFLSTEEIQARQEQVKELQLQLDRQRETLIFKQRLQDELLLLKQNELKQRQQEVMEGFFKSQKAIQTSFLVDKSESQRNEQFSWLSSLCPLENNVHEKADHCNRDETETVLGREQRWRLLKPPVTKTKPGLVLEPHELSTIPETESPSGRSSALGGKIATEEESFLSGVTDSDLSKISTSKDQSTSTLTRDSSSHSSRLSWRERLMLDAGMTHDSGQCGDSVVVEVLPSYTADIGRGILQYPDSQCRLKSQASSASAFSPQTQDAVSDQGSSVTISTGSIFTNESLESSPSNIVPAFVADFSYIDQSSFQQPCFHPLQPRPDFDLSSSSCEQLQKLGNSEDTGELSKDSLFSRKRQDLCHESTDSHLQVNCNSLDSPSFGSIKSYSIALSSIGSSKESITHDSSGSFHLLHPETTLGEQNLINDGTLAAIISGQFWGQSTQNQNRVTGKEFVLLPAKEGDDIIAGNTENLRSLQSSVENLRSQNSNLGSQNSFEEISSFYELRDTQDTIDDSALSEHSVEGGLEFIKKGSCSFEELPGLKYDQAGHAQEEQNTDKETHIFVDKSECHPLDGQISTLQTQCKLSENTNVQMLGTDLEPKVVQSRPKVSDNKLSGDCSIQSSIPVWETESGHGIMEEPELTLISLNDSTVTVPDLEQTKREENRESEINNLTHTTDDPEFRSSSRSGFLPFLSEVDDSIFIEHDSLIDQCSAVRPSSSQQFAVMQLDVASCPGSLQEAFLKRKMDFIKRSCQRLEEIKKRGDTPGKIGTTHTPTEESLLQRTLSSSVAPTAYQLKKVGEVKVCTPEDRKSVEVQMYQRTLRLYNQLNEVKTRKDEQARQDSYAKNREKAKEFKKRTLQKLRAKK
nr:centrosomal protein of 295 kDa isoform X2 [Geotrypetes seraphini]XP_033806376.1 centrosomal protein of 295 kDa isoform X2 [Geotrypetes seraphini]